MKRALVDRDLDMFSPILDNDWWREVGTIIILDNDWWRYVGTIIILDNDWWREVGAIFS